MWTKAAVLLCACATAAVMTSSSDVVAGTPGQARGVDDHLSSPPPVGYTHCVAEKNDTDAAHSNFNVHRPMLVVFVRDVAERVCHRMTACFPTSPD